MFFYNSLKSPLFGLQQPPLFIWFLLLIDLGLTDPPLLILNTCILRPQMSLLILTLLKIPLDLPNNLLLNFLQLPYPLTIAIIDLFYLLLNFPPSSSSLLLNSCQFDIIEIIIFDLMVEFLLEDFDWLLSAY
jgi:hypothetical protein